MKREFNGSQWDRIFTALLAFCLFLAGSELSRAQGGAGRSDFVSWAKSNSVPLQANENDFRKNGARLKEMIGSARVVAVGEPSHGVHEPMAFRNELFRFLVEEMGFTAIATESSLTDSKVVSEFITGNGNAIPQLGQLPSGENQELLEWIKAYNANPEHRRKVRFYGVDLGLGGLGNSYPTPAPIRAALEYVAGLNAEAAAPLKAKLEPHLARLPGPGNGPPPYSSAEHDSLTGAIEDLIGLLERDRTKFIAGSSKVAYEWAHRNAIVARQADQVFRTSPPDARPGQIPPEAWRSASARDAAMADNVLWALNQEGPQGRILFFAHNAHVKSAPTEGGVWDVFQHPPNAAGQYLRTSLGDGLTIIGMSAHATGSPRPRSAKPIESLDEALGEVRPGSFVIDLRGSTIPSGAEQWLMAPKTLTANNDSFVVVKPRVAFDVIYFVERLTWQLPAKAGR